MSDSESYLNRVEAERQNRIIQMRRTKKRPLLIALSKFERNILVQALTGQPGSDDGDVRRLRERLAGLTE